MKARRQQNPPRTSPLLLIADDELDCRVLLSEYFLFHGYEVATAADGSEAIAQAAALSPDLILMDLRMPVLDGREATRRLKSDPATAMIPVVAITVQGEDLEQGAFDAGCLAVIAKPFDLRYLEQEIRRLLGRT